MKYGNAEYVFVQNDSEWRDSSYKTKCWKNSKMRQMRYFNVLLSTGKSVTSRFKQPNVEFIHSKSFIKS